MNGTDHSRDRTPPAAAATVQPRGGEGSSAEGGGGAVRGGRGGTRLCQIGYNHSSVISGRASERNCFEWVVYAIDSICFGLVLDADFLDCFRILVRAIFDYPLIVN